MSLMFLVLLAHIKQRFTFVQTFNLLEEMLKESYDLMLWSGLQNQEALSGLFV